MYFNEICLNVFHWPWVPFRSNAPHLYYTVRNELLYVIDETKETEKYVFKICTHIYQISKWYKIFPIYFFHSNSNENHFGLELYHFIKKNIFRHFSLYCAVANLDISDLLIYLFRDGVQFYSWWNNWNFCISWKNTRPFKKKKLFIIFRTSTSISSYGIYFLV